MSHLANHAALALGRVKAAIPRKHRYRIRGVLMALVSILFAGRRVTCPCCGGRFRRFTRLYGPDACCPRCGAAERHRLLTLYLERETEIGSSPLTLLHFGPEYGLLRKLRSATNLRYIPADLDPPAGAFKMDMTDCPLDDASVDMVISSCVLEHVEDDRRAMSEMHRVLRRGGVGLHVVPVDDAREQTFEDSSIVSPKDRRRAFGQDDHVRIYGRDFVARMQAAGFDVHPLRYAQELDRASRSHFGLNDAIIYACSKSSAPRARLDSSEPRSEA